MEGIWLLSYLVLWLCVLALGSTVVLILRQLGLQYLGAPEALARDGLPSGSPAPRFTAEALDGSEYVIGGAGEPTLLVFGSPSCRPCRELIPDLNAFTAEHAAGLRVLFVSGGRYEAIKRFAETTSLQVPILSGGDQTIALLYRARVTPFGFFIDAQGVIIRKGVASTREQLDWLAFGAQPGAPPAREASQGELHVQGDIQGNGRLLTQAHQAQAVTRPREGSGPTRTR